MNPHLLGSWQQVTNGGRIRSRAEVPGANALYAVSGIVHPEHRGGKVLAALMMAAADAARKEGLTYYTAGAVIPCYKSYCARNGEISAADYVFTKRGNRLVEPFLDQYRRNGFHVPDRAHVLANYYADEGSGNYAALVVKKVLPA
jgi:GNAT superfamily N-acetyltransferase